MSRKGFGNLGGGTGLFVPLLSAPLLIFCAPLCITEGWMPERYLPETSLPAGFCQTLTPWQVSRSWEEGNQAKTHTFFRWGGQSVQHRLQLQLQRVTVSPWALPQAACFQQLVQVSGGIAKQQQLQGLQRPWLTCPDSVCFSDRCKELWAPGFPPQQQENGPWFPRGSFLTASRQQRPQWGPAAPQGSDCLTEDTLSLLLGQPKMALAYCRY